MDIKVNISKKLFNLNENWSTDESRKGYEAYQKIIELTNSCKDYLRNNFLSSESITPYDQHRVKQICSQLNLITELLKLLFALISKFNSSVSNDSFMYFIDRIIKSCLFNINSYLKQPFCIFPDLSLYFLCNGEPVGVCIIKASDVIWSENELEMGCICAKMIYIDVKVSRVFLLGSQYRVLYPFIVNYH